MSGAAKYAVAFARFWYDFTVGDSVVLAIGGAGSIAIGALLAHNNAGAIVEPVLPAVVIATLAISLRRLPRTGG